MFPVWGDCMDSGPTERMRLAMASALAAATAPPVRYTQVSRYSVNGTSKSTMRPRASSLRASSSS